METLGELRGAIAASLGKFPGDKSTPLREGKKADD